MLAKFSLPTLDLSKSKQGLYSTYNGSCIGVCQPLRKYVVIIIGVKMNTFNFLVLIGGTLLVSLQISFFKFDWSITWFCKPRIHFWRGNLLVLWCNYSLTSFQCVHLVINDTNKQMEFSPLIMIEIVKTSWYKLCFRRQLLIIMPQG